MTDVNKMGPFAFCQQWEESERGWGVRPDGYSLHLSLEDVEKYIKQYWEKQKDGPAPDEYSRNCGKPYMCTISAQLHGQLIEEKRKGSFGRRFFDSYPKPVGE
jgi:hypothetical protein